MTTPSPLVLRTGRAGYNHNSQHTEGGVQKVNKLPKRKKKKKKSKSRRGFLPSPWTMEDFLWKSQVCHLILPSSIFFQKKIYRKSTLKDSLHYLLAWIFDKQYFKRLLLPYKHSFKKSLKPLTLPTAEHVGLFIFTLVEKKLFFNTKKKKNLLN